MARRLIAVHHRLVGRAGHRFGEALGIVRECPRRGFEPVILINEEAGAPVREALPQALPVLHDPVFRRDLDFDGRTEDFAAMLRRHVEPLARRGDVVLMTVATQCEVRAFASWLRGLPQGQRPGVVFYFHSDRWNRYGPDERRRQLAEFETTARELAALRRPDGAGLLLGAATPPLARELAGLLGAPVHPAPLPMVYGAIVAATGRGRRPVAAMPCIGFLGGARPEKGFHRVARIVAAVRDRVPARFLVHLVNEGLAPGDWETLQALAGAPDVDVVRGALAVEPWAEAIAACDVVALPYEVAPYRQRSSGVLADAVAAGRPVVVPAGTWPAQLVARGEAAGVLYDPARHVEGAAAAVAECVERLPELGAAAASLAAPWAQRQSLAALLDWVEAGLA